MLRHGAIHVVGQRRACYSDHCLLYFWRKSLTRLRVEVDPLRGRHRLWSSGASAICPDTKVRVFESISNPTLEVIDIDRCAPRLPMPYGATGGCRQCLCHAGSIRGAGTGGVVIYSATKHI